MTSLFEAEDGTLWIGHETGEVSSYRAGRFATNKVTAKWTGGKIQDRHGCEGDIWMLNADGLLARLRDGLVLTPESGTASKVFELTRSRGGKIWVSRDGRISELQEGSLRPLPFTEANTNHYVWAMGASRDEGLWLGVGTKSASGRTTPGLMIFGRAPGLANHSQSGGNQTGELAITASTRGFALVRPGSESPVIFNRASGFQSDWVISPVKIAKAISGWEQAGGTGVLRPGVLQTVLPPDEWLGGRCCPYRRVAMARCGSARKARGCTNSATANGTALPSAPASVCPYVWSVLEDAQRQLWVGTWNGLLSRQGNRFEAPPGLESMSDHVTALLPSESGGCGWALERDCCIIRRAKVPGPCSMETRQSGDVRASRKHPTARSGLSMAGGGLGLLRGEQVQWFHKADGLASRIHQLFPFRE